MKFGRRCQLVVEINPEPAQGSDFSVATNRLTIPADLTVDFDINRQALGSSQTGTFRIYNLSEKTRNLLFRDPYEMSYRAIQFRAGYADSPVLPLCFNGFLLSALSYREGVNFITEIKAYDGGLSMGNGITSQTVVIGQTMSQILRRLSLGLPRVSALPIIGSFPTLNLRGLSLFGNTWNVLLELSDGLAFVDNGQIKILNYNEAINGTIPLLDAASGLLGVPQRGATKIEAEFEFEPRLTLGQFVELRGMSNRFLNQTYKVVGIHHHGTAPSTGERSSYLPAATSGGQAISDISLYFGSQEFSQAQVASGRARAGPFQIVEGAVFQ